MKEIKDLDRDIILKAISAIKNNPEKRNGRESTTYDLIHEGETFPPILVLSEANKIVGGDELMLSDFNNSTSQAFSVLRRHGFKIEPKMNGESTSISSTIKFSLEENNAWVEKTIVSGREDRLVGEYALGKRLWSPRKSKGGTDIYKNMTRIKPGDLIIHLVDNDSIKGISRAVDTYSEGEGVLGSEWEGDAYLVELKDFKEIENIDRDRILSDKYRPILDRIRNENDVFYDRNLNLRQGAYLTECPIELLDIINSEYEKMTQSNLPFINSKELKKSSSKAFNIESLIASTKESGLHYDENIVHRFVYALITKQFLILTGLSGSGKTKLAQAFAKWIIEDKKQLDLVPVGADWTNREPLLGYPNALEKGQYVFPESGVLQLILNAIKDPDRPYILILDEMNLSHVERYFADFLSAIESNEEVKLHSGEAPWEAGEYQIPPTLSIPKNLFIIGTVNIDETTYMFSPKVLDRANVIEFRVSQEGLAKFLENPAVVDLDILSNQGASMAEDFVQIATNNADDYSLKESISKELLKFFNELNAVGAEFGYRSAYEIQRFAALAEQLTEDWKLEQIMDAAIAQKLLPKLHGSRRKLEKVLFRLGQLCLTEGDAEELLKKQESIIWEHVKYPISFEKIVRMHKGLVENGFTSFAEA